MFPFHSKNWHAFDFTLNIYPDVNMLLCKYILKTNRMEGDIEDTKAKTRIN